MVVRVVSISEPKESKKVSTPLMAVLGGMAGYSLKYAIPLSKTEINEATDFQYQNIINQKGFEAKKAELEELALLLKKKPDPALDTFLKSKIKLNVNSGFTETKDFKTSRELCRKGAPELVSRIREYAHGVAVKVKIARSSTKFLLDSSIKNSRPASVFVVPGVVLGVIGAFVYNVIGKFRES